MPLSRSQVVQYIFSIKNSRIGDISHVGINVKIRGLYLAHIVHGLLHRIHEFRLHGLESQHNSRLGSQLRSPPQIRLKPGRSLPRGLFIVHVVPRKLDNPYPKILCQANGLLHDLHASGPDSRILTADRVFSVSAQAHGTDRHSGFGHKPYQLPSVFCGHPQPGQLFLTFVNAHLHKIIPGFFRLFQLFPPAKPGGHGLFIQSQSVFLPHIVPPLIRHSNARNGTFGSSVKQSSKPLL